MLKFILVVAVVLVLVGCTTVSFNIPGVDNKHASMATTTCTVGRDAYQYGNAPKPYKPAFSDVIKCYGGNIQINR